MSVKTRAKNDVQGEPLTLATPLVGSVLTILSGLSFLFLSMCLPLVGKAGAVTPNYTKNLIAFTVVLIVTLALSSLATVSKQQRREIDGSPRPYFSMILLGLTVMLGISLMLGLLKI